MSDDEPKTISYSEAVALLRDTKYVHTFRNPGVGMLLGADWERDEILIALRSALEIHVTGAQAQAMNHGLAIQTERGWLFIETKTS